MFITKNSNILFIGLLTMNKNKVSDHQSYSRRSGSPSRSKISRIRSSRIIRSRSRSPSARSRSHTDRTSGQSRINRSLSRSPSARSRSHTDRTIGNRNRRCLNELCTNLEPHEQLHVLEQNISKWEDMLRKDIDNASRSFSSAGDENPHQDISFLTYAMKVLDYLEKKSVDLTSSKFTMSDSEWVLYDSKY